MTQSVTLDHFPFANILTLPWPLPTGDFNVALATPNLLVNLRPSEPSLRTTVLLI